MTVHVVVVDPPRPGLVLPGLVETTPLSPDEAADLYSAMVKDALRAVERSGGELVVNYPTADDVPVEDPDGRSPEAELRSLASQALGDPDAARFEVQVGSDFAAIAGNAATHLLREEDVNTVAVMDGTAPTMARTDLDNAAMKLRRNHVVIGPAPGGRVSYLGVSDPIDFAGAYDPPALETLADRAEAAGLDTDFLPMHGVVEREPDLVTLLSVLEARQTAGRSTPPFTTDVLDRLDLGIRVEGDGREVVVAD